MNKEVVSAKLESLRRCVQRIKNINYHEAAYRLCGVRQSGEQNCGTAMSLFLQNSKLNYYFKTQKLERLNRSG